MLGRKIRRPVVIVRKSGDDSSLAKGYAFNDDPSTPFFSSRISCRKYYSKVLVTSLTAPEAAFAGAPLVHVRCNVVSTF